ncbi:MAG: phosphatase PAP2 family protein, partial [Actinomycetota bacterium]|nr:phosphatase PAP2 family protein [Actinomycetota bacterium]
PGTFVQEVLLRGRAQTGLGFPSGHAAVATTMTCVALPHLRPALRVPVCGWVAIVGAARMYVGAHLPVDIAGGVGLGLAVGDASRRLAQVESGRSTRMAG